MSDHTAAPPAGPSRLIFAILEGGSLFSLGLAAGMARPSENWWWCGLLCGVISGIAYWNPFRAGGLVPFGLSAATLGAGGILVFGWAPAWVVVLGAGLGLSLGGLNTAGKFATIPAAPLAWRLVYASLAVAVMVAPDAMVDWGKLERAAIERAYNLASVTLLLGLTVTAWLHLLRPATELAAEPFLWLMYRVRPAGSGLAHMSPVGPCLVIANHGCWFDPLFLGKILPRRTTPMMTSRFYDLPGMRWLMRRFGVIRVLDHQFRHDAPEIQLAIAALDRGECVVLFPEGFLRRTEDRLLRRFGRGVWQILKARPDTPVYACWIEGGWGSYTSYQNGPPTRNKRRDWGRTIRIAVAEPITVPAEVLESHLPTRVYLMNRVLDARKPLNLPEVPLFPMPASGTRDETDDSDDPDLGTPGTVAQS